MIALFLIPYSIGNADLKVTITPVPPKIENKVLSDVEKVAQETGYKPQTIKKILDCESGDNQDARHLNSDGTWDIGTAQINITWGKTAEKMGIDILTREGNLKFMTYLIKNNALRDYKASEWCWSGTL